MNHNDQSAEIVAAWGESAEYWQKHNGLIRRMFAPVTRVLIQAAGIAEGQSVLDVAGGVGEPSLSIAPMVGPSGSVTYTDAAEPMYAAARRFAEAQGLSSISFYHAPAESLPFPSDQFEAVVCRFGAMFFADPLAACREMLRVAKPAAKLAFTVWRAREQNPFFYCISDVLDRFIPPTPEEPDSPGAYRYSESGRFASVLREAGAGNVTESIQDFRIAAPINVDGYWTLRSEMSDTLRAKLKKLSDTQVEEVKQQVRDAAGRFFASGTMDFPAQFIVITGLKK